MSSYHTVRSAPQSYGLQWKGPTFTHEEIVAFLKLLHPDVFEETPDLPQEGAEEIVKLVSEAWQKIRRNK